MTPFFPTYSNAVLFINLMIDQSSEVFTAMRKTIKDSTGTPQSQRDWEQPDKWIPEVLSDSERELAQHIWNASKQHINPRHTKGLAMFIQKYELLKISDDHSYYTSEAGDLFQSNLEGLSVKTIDLEEGLMYLLFLFNEHGPSQRSGIFEDFSTYANSKGAQAESFINSLWQFRRVNLIDRGFLEETKNNVYQITENGKDWLSSCEEKELRTMRDFKTKHQHSSEATKADPDDAVADVKPVKASVEKEIKNTQKREVELEKALKTQDTEARSLVAEQLSNCEKLNQVASPQKQIFALGSAWGGKSDQTDRFLKDGIWENGSEDDIKQVAEVNVDDIVVLKSVFQKGNKGQFRIKAIGKVWQRDSRGVFLKIDWFLRADNLDVTGHLSGSRSRIARLKWRDFAEIVHAIPPKEVLSTKLLEAGFWSKETTPSGDAIPETTPIETEHFLDVSETIAYGQRIGREIRDYQIFFLPKSVVGGVSANAVAGHVLKILGIERKSLKFDDLGLGQVRHKWFKFSSNSSTIYICFIISRDENNVFEAFGQNMNGAISGFLNLYPHEAIQVPEKIFIPLLGAGRGGTDPKTSLEIVIESLLLFRDAFVGPRIRVNFPREATKAELEEYGSMVLDRLALNPHPDFARLPIDDDRGGEVNIELKGTGTPEFIAAPAPTLDVIPLANATAAVIEKLSSEPQQGMIGIFGRWGRGKTRFVDILCKESLSKVDREYVRIDYNAWKYQDTPASWAYLYETVADAFYLEGYPDKKDEKLRLIDNWPKRIGSLLANFKWYDWLNMLFPLLIVIVSVVSVKRARVFVHNFKVKPIPVRVFFVTTLALLVIRIIITHVDAQIVLNWILAGSSVFSLGWVIFLMRRASKAKKILSSYARKTSFANLLGKQAEIQDALKILLTTWIRKSDAKKQLLLFVDDIDRCHEDRIIDLIDSLRIMLDDYEIRNRMLILTAIDERMMQRAIQFKYERINKCDVNLTADGIPSKDAINEQIQEYFDKLFVFGIKLRPLSTGDNCEIAKSVLEAIDINLSKRVKEHPENLESPSGPSSALNNENTPVEEIDHEHEPVEYIDEDLAVPENEVEHVRSGQVNESAEQENALLSGEVLISVAESSNIYEAVAQLTESTPRKIKILIYKYIFARELLRELLKDDLTGTEAKVLLALLVYFEMNPKRQAANRIQTHFNAPDPLEELGFTTILNQLPDLSPQGQTKFLNAFAAVNY
jgi:hypothetical protein